MEQKILELLIKNGGLYETSILKEVCDSEDYRLMGEVYQAAITLIDKGLVVAGKNEHGRYFTIPRILH